MRNNYCLVVWLDKDTSKKNIETSVESYVLCTDSLVVKDNCKLGVVELNNKVAEELGIEQAYQINYMFDCEQGDYDHLVRMLEIQKNKGRILGYHGFVIHENIEFRNNELEFSDELENILDIYDGGCSNWREEPLDREEIDRLIEHLRNELYFMNDIITQEEYNKVEVVNNV